MKVSELKDLIRSVVNEEVEHAVARVLSERYLSKIVKEAASAPRQVGRVNEAALRLATQLPANDDDEQSIRELVRRNSPKPGPRRVLNNELVSQKNPLNFVYEGTSPIPAATAAPESSNVSIDEMQNELGLDFGRMAQMANINRAPQKTMNSEMRRIDEMRKALEIPVPVAK